VAVHSYSHEQMQPISDLDINMLAQVQEFFISYNKQRGKKFKVTGTGGPNKAIKFVLKASLRSAA
jgi:inorganic pyrophosphatase